MAFSSPTCDPACIDASGVPGGAELAALLASLAAPDLTRTSRRFG